MLALARVSWWPARVLRSCCLRRAGRVLVRGVADTQNWEEEEEAAAAFGGACFQNFSRSRRARVAQCDTITLTPRAHHTASLTRARVCECAKDAPPEQRHWDARVCRHVWEEGLHVAEGHRQPMEGERLRVSHRVARCAPPLGRRVASAAAAAPV